jgi:hypothetical protein
MWKFECAEFVFMVLLSYLSDRRAYYSFVTVLCNKQYCFKQYLTFLVAYRGGQGPKAALIAAKFYGKRSK